MGDYISRDMAIARLTKVEVTNRLATMTDAKRVIAERERLERLFEEARQIADRRAWDETSRTMAYNCGQEAKDGQ